MPPPFCRSYRLRSWTLPPQNSPWPGGTCTWPNGGPDCRPSPACQSCPCMNCPKEQNNCNKLSMTRLGSRVPIVNHQDSLTCSSWKWLWSSSMALVIFTPLRASTMYFSPAVKRAIVMKTRGCSRSMTEPSSRSMIASSNGMLDWKAGEGQNRRWGLEPGLGFKGAPCLDMSCHSLSLITHLSSKIFHDCSMFFFSNQHSHQPMPCVRALDQRLFFFLQSGPVDVDIGVSRTISAFQLISPPQQKQQ